MFYPHGMAFLEDATSQSSFFRRMKAFYGGRSEAYKKIEWTDMLTQELFSGEYRLTGEEYIIHPRSVALIATELVKVHDYQVIVGCIIHDNREYAEVYGTNQWDTKFVQSWFDPRVERLLASQTMPCVRGKMTREKAHEIYYRRMSESECADSRDFFEIKLPDRLHNLWTLSSDIMPVGKVREKIVETEVHYVPHAVRHGILVQEFREVLRWLKDNN